MRVSTAEEARAVLKPYADRKSQVFRTEEMSEGIAEALLHKAFSGNAMAAAQYLGYKSHESVTRRWQVYGLEAMGRDNNRRDYDAERARKVDARLIDPSTGDVSGDLSDDELLAHWRRKTQVVERAIEREWKVPADMEFARLHCLGDLHFGNRHQDSERLEAFVSWLAEQPHDRWLIAGDVFEVSSKLSPGGPPLYDHATSFRLACLVLGPIMDKCLVIHTGNHDQRIKVQTGMEWDPTLDFAAHFGVKWGGKDGFHRIKLSCGRHTQTYDGYVHHGWGGAQTKGAKANQIQKAIRDTTADYVVLAHLHDLDSLTDTSFGPDEEGIVRLIDRAGIRCGSWLRHSPGSYSRESGMSPGQPGAGTFHLYTQRHAVHPRT